MEIIENKPIYKCNHCGKYLIRKYAMIKHEVQCSKNHINYPNCVGCSFLEEKKEYIEFNPHSGMWSRSFYCNKKQIGLYPNKVIYKGLLEKYPKQFENCINMPIKCNDFEFDNEFDNEF